VGANHRDTLSTLANVAVGYAALERMEDALALYRAAHAGLRRAAGEDHPWTLIMQSNICAALVELGRVDEALPLAIDLVPRAERAMGREHLYTMRWIGLLGIAFQLSGNPSAALAQYRRALELQRKALGEDNRDTLETLSHIGEAEFDSGMRVEGLATMERAVDELRRVSGPANRVTLSATVALANAQAAMGDRAKAIRLLDAVVAAVETLRSDEGLSRETRQAFFARWSGGYKRLAFLLAQHDVERAFRAAELSKARTLLESLALRNADMAGILDAADAARLARFDARASELTNAVAQAPTPEEGFRLETERNGVSREASAFRRDLRTRYPRYAQLSEVELIDATAAAGLPRRNEGFVSYLVLDDEVLAFVATRGAALRVIELGTIPGLEGSIGAYRRLLAGALAADPLPVWRLRDGRYVVSLARPADAVQRVTDPRGVGEALAQRLLRPLEKALAGTTHWVISPDAALATLPFEALPRDGRPLAATRSVTYVQSLSVAALMQARPAAGSAKRDLLAMGAPQFVASGGRGGARASTMPPAGWPSRWLAARCRAPSLPATR
jgi:tetratricopeptide (TPR) repeat protein